MKFTILNCRERYEDMIDNCSYTCSEAAVKLKPEKNQALISLLL